MLLRKDKEGVVAIPQPSHAWLSGQLARAWGNSDFAAPAPNEEVCIAAEQHDIGWLQWERRPALDPGTGLPQEFFRLQPKNTSRSGAKVSPGPAPSDATPRFWSRCTRRRSTSAISILARHGQKDAAAVRAFLAGQRRFQAKTAALLRDDPKTSREATPETVEFNRLLIAALDRISLEICWGVKTDVAITDVPKAHGESVELRLAPDADETLVVDPWPFHAPRVALRAEGKRLTGCFSTQRELNSALAGAGSVLVTAELRKA
jgi:Protein of unknown function (DUF3891)